MRKYSTGLKELDELWGGYQSTLMERLSDGIAALYCTVVEGNL